MLLLLFLLWIIFNGKITVEIILFGIVLSIVLMLFLCKFIDYSWEKEGKVYRNFFRGLSYVVLLVIEIVKANIQVLHFIISSKFDIQPKIIHFKTNLKSDAARVTLANSITLTPGTITVDVSEDEYIVHCLDDDLAVGVDDSEFLHRLQKMEEK